MKTKLTLALMSVFMMLSTFAFASFPVERQVTTQVVTLENGTSIEESTTSLTTPAAVVWSENQTIATLLWVFLWPLAGHRWYLKSPIGWNILFILTAGGFGIWALIDLIEILTGSYPGL
jgi:hypothetical protein